MKWRQTILAFIVTIFSGCTLFGTPEQTNNHYDLWIIVHGTWAPENDWYQPGGSFFDAIEKGTSIKPGSRVIPFRWSGGTRDHDRFRGGQQLKKLIQSYPLSTRIHIVGHSHGATIGIIASKLLAKDKNNQHRITSLFTVGVPVDHMHALPDYTVIDHLVNLFSYGDVHQPFFNFYRRELPNHEQCINLRATINKKEPNHFEIHDESFGYWIPYMMELISRDKKPFNTPRVITIFDQEPKEPIIEEDYLREILHEFDIRYHNKMRNRAHIFFSTLRDCAPDLGLLSPKNISLKNIRSALGSVGKQVTSVTFLVVQKMYVGLLNSLKSEQKPMAKKTKK